jgi:hypothetical protein
LFVEEVQLPQLALQQEAVMLGERSLQSLGQLLSFLAHAPTGQLGEFVWVPLPVKQGLQNGTPRFAGDIGCYRGQFDVGVFQHFLDTIDQSPSIGS